MKDKNETGFCPASDLEESPADRRKRRVRETIMEAAEKVFSREGVEGLSMRRLAEEVDYSPAALYKYFASKDELLVSIRESFFERLIAMIEERIATEGKTVESFRRCLSGYVRLGLRYPNHYRMGLSGDLGAPTEDTRTFEAAMLLEAMIAHGMNEGWFEAGDPKLCAKVVWAALHGLTSLMVEHDEFPEGMPGSECYGRDDVIEAQADMILRGLRGVKGVSS